MKLLLTMSLTSLMLAGCSSYNPYNYERNYQPDRPVMQSQQNPVSVIINSNVLFNVDSPDINPQFYLYLNNLATAIIQNKNTITIIGHTDNSGNKERNLQLSLDRANSVANYLYAQGVPQNSIIVQGMGDAYPLADNGTDAGRQKNRRVELLIQ